MWSCKEIGYILPFVYFSLVLKQLAKAISLQPTHSDIHLGWYKVWAVSERFNAIFFRLLAKKISKVGKCKVTLLQLAIEK
jgi:hypothetical protein